MASCMLAGGRCEGAWPLRKWLRCLLQAARCAQQNPLCAMPAERRQARCACRAVVCTQPQRRAVRSLVAGRWVGTWRPRQQPRRMLLLRRRMMKRRKLRRREAAARLLPGLQCLAARGLHPAAVVDARYGVPLHACRSRSYTLATHSPQAQSPDVACLSRGAGPRQWRLLHRGKQLGGGAFKPLTRLAGSGGKRVAERIRRRLGRGGRALRAQCGVGIPAGVKEY